MTVRVRVQFSVTGDSAQDIYAKAWQRASEFFGSPPDDMEIEAREEDPPAVYEAVVVAFAAGNPPGVGIKTDRGY